MRKLLLSSVALIAMPALADPVVDTRKIMAGTVTTQKIKNEYISGARDGTAPFKGALSAYKAVRAAEPPLTVKCADGTVIVAPGACPVPVPPVSNNTEPPMPAGDLLAPTLAGLAPIDDTLDATAWTDPSPIPGSSGGQLTGNFRMVCNAGQVLFDDPILFPGQPGKSHLHQFYGNLAADANSTYPSLRAKGDSTCVNPLNRSGYWQPAMLDGKGNVVRPDYVVIYYKRRPASDPIVSDPTNPRYEGKAAGIPNGLRFIFGWDPTGLNAAPTGSAYFNCDGATAVSGHYLKMSDALAHCPAGNKLGAIIAAPGCWDGKRLDAADHRSHVGYASYGEWGYLKCPAATPYVIPQFTLQAWYSVAAGDDTSKWHLSSDEMIPGAEPGSTFHADYFEAWKPSVKAAWHDNCIDKQLDCQSGNLGNGRGLKLFPGWGWWATPRLVPIPPRP